MRHLQEHELVAHFYGDEAGSECATAERHLAECEGCRAELEALRNTLSAVAAAQPEVPERDEAYGTEVWNRIRAHLPETEERSWSAWLQPRRWLPIGAIAALIFIAFIAGRLSQRPQPAPPEIAGETGDQAASDRLLLVAVGRHLERSQTLLVELMNTPADRLVDISLEQQRAEDLISANRLYRQSTVNAGDQQIAEVLEELERVLLDVARQPGKVSGAELAQIQQRIDSRGVLFKVRVIGANIRAEQAPERKRNGNTELRKTT